MDNTDVDRRSASSKVAKTFVLPLLTAIFTVVFTPMAVLTWRQARYNWLIVSSAGIVTGTRLIRHPRPLPRARGPWHIIWEVDCGPARAEHVSVTAPSSYHGEDDARQASSGDVGRQVIVWHVPGDSRFGSLVPPEWDRGVIAAVWTTVMASIGWFGVVGYSHLAWRKIRCQSARITTFDTAKSDSVRRSRSP